VVPDKKSKIYIALPALNEFEYVHQFISCLDKQTFRIFELFVCVNQPDHWWEDAAKLSICENNQATIKYLETIDNFPVTIIDRSSTGSGWKGNHYGVGWARKIIMEAINLIANPDDIIVSLDADTTFNPEYLNAIKDSFYSHPSHTSAANAGLSVPYYHNLTGDEVADRQILRYEIYMRYYAINMWRIGNPYCFTAIGSAMAVPVWLYRKIGGITPHKSGEDFYFMQKLRKSGEINHWCDEKVFPAARFSDRVFFGTGPAMIKGRGGDWKSYPIYDYRLFDLVNETFNLFIELYENDVDTPMDLFLRTTFKEENIWNPLRENYKTQEQFVRACASKIDGLRILQFLKAEQKKSDRSDQENLVEFFMSVLAGRLDLGEYGNREIREYGNKEIEVYVNFEDVKLLDSIRNLFMRIEENFRKN